MLKLWIADFFFTVSAWLLHVSEAAFDFGTALETGRSYAVVRAERRANRAGGENA